MGSNPRGVGILTTLTGRGSLKLRDEIISSYSGVRNDQ